MNRSKTLQGGVGGLLLILALAFYNGPQKIEQDLTTRGAAILDQGGLPWATLQAHGRDLLLTGQAPSERAKNKALELIQALDGANHVTTDFTTPPSNGTTDERPTSDSPWSSSIKKR